MVGLSVFAVAFLARRRILQVGCADWDYQRLVYRLKFQRSRLGK